MKDYVIRGIFAAILAILILAIGLRDPFSGVARAAGDKEYLAILHMSQGHTCESCHKENPPTAKKCHVTCMGCHGNAMKMAERTKNRNPNPHADSPDRDCTYCHYGHK